MGTTKPPKPQRFGGLQSRERLNLRIRPDPVLR